ncbi:hypothetical protein AC579_124 [Pseudocercospora musae]|uniref:Homeobox domain-containing protein n=1 Tax=Pseudocercospora musae TaxID=113226 RepID=A0A139ILQ3_9PEZI|nr:hypothetical protein AC579_124 [Pseudocercospora musae]
MATREPEQHGELAPVDFSSLLPDVTFGGTTDALIARELTSGPLRPDQCPLHPHLDESCLCNGFVGDWHQLESASAAEPLPGIAEPDYSKFENWIPRFIHPEKPCDYCRSKRLACYMQRGEPFCTSCAVLFRECSFTKSNTLEAMNYADKDLGTFLDTLHTVDEDSLRERGTLTGIKTLRSKGIGGGTSAPVRSDDAPGSSKRNGIRFPRHAVKILRDWLDAHVNNPYPSEEEKAELEKQTELKPAQIANWLANARRRRKVTEKARPKVAMSPSLRPTTCPIDIPSTPEKTWDDMNPFERWQHSPPENEPADLSDIANAIAQSDIPADDASSTSPSTLARSKRRKVSSDGSGWSKARAPSLTSQETGRTSSLSASTSARFSNGSSHSTHGSFGSFSSSLAGKKDRRRRRRPAPPAVGRKLTDDKKRMFQCTFCTDTFKSKYDWTRHEKSLHLSLEKWICAPLGPILTDQESGNKKCVYCDLHNPSSDHLESHNHRQCEDKGLDARTFYRKDHLRQHLRLMHGCEMTPAMDSWKSVAVSINSRCGFCAQRFTAWQERVDHLTAHFKAGARMSEWKGCRGLDPAVAAQVTNAMPPYLIGIESVSPNPFSASNRASWRQVQEFGENTAPQDEHDDMQDAHSGGSGSKSTCWEILTVRLGKYAKKMADEGKQMTDEMLQSEARQILYNSDDTWNQTAADNPEWLDLFKKAHGLNFIPSAVGGEGSQIPEDLEAYGDLGLRIPFAVQLRAYNQAQTGQQRVDAATRPGPYKAAAEKRKHNLQQVYTFLSVQNVLHTDIENCDHAECAKNIIDISTVNATYSRWCDQDITPELRQKPQNINSPASSQQKQSDDHEGSERAAAARARGLQVLVDQENVACPWQPIEHDLIAARARTRGLAALDAHGKSHETCAWEQSDYDLKKARARKHGLQALARAEAPGTDDCMPSDFMLPLPKKSLLQRHRYELPNKLANMFATTTGAWEDSGIMPQAVHMSLTNIPETSTGAMAEFLGGNLGADLSFINDAITSSIDAAPLTSAENFEWQLPAGEDFSPEELMDLMKPTTAPDFDPMTAVESNWNMDVMRSTNTSSSMNLPSDLHMNDISLDEMNFDDMIFDMPLDDTFGATSGA